MYFDHSFPIILSYPLLFLLIPFCLPASPLSFFGQNLPPTVTYVFQPGHTNEAIPSNSDPMKL